MSVTVRTGMSVARSSHSVAVMLVMVPSSGSTDREVVVIAAARYVLSAAVTADSSVILPPLVVSLRKVPVAVLPAQLPWPVQVVPFRKGKARWTMPGEHVSRVMISPAARVVVSTVATSRTVHESVVTASLPSKLVREVTEVDPPFALPTSTWTIKLVVVPCDSRRKR